MTEGLVLYPSANIVESLIGEFHEMERIGDLDCAGQHRGERQPPRPREIQRGPSDAIEPRPVPFGEPRACSCR